ncbi:hypothetical protein JMJ77_0008197, partial [Colletotrichum scovillei]
MPVCALLVLRLRDGTQIWASSNRGGILSQ